MTILAALLAAVAPLTLSHASHDQRMDRVLVAMVRFDDREPFTREAVQKIILDDTFRYFREGSYGKLRLTGEVLDWRQVEVKERCDTDELKDRAIEAIDDDVDFRKYGRLVIVFPSSGCDYGGMGTVGAWHIKTGEGILKYSISWLPGLPSLRVTTHELGHNLGLNHASLLDCEGETLNADTSKCGDLEYADPYDAMGSASPRHFSAYHKRQLDWISEEQFPRVPRKDGVYTYRLSPLETKGGIKGVRVPISPKDGGVEAEGLRSEFVIEFRQPIGFDEGLFGNRDDYDGALVHIPLKTKHGDSTFLHTHLLDMSPSDDGHALRVGKSWDAPNGQVTLKAVKLHRGQLEIKVLISNVGDRRNLFARLWDGVSDGLRSLFGGQRQEDKGGDGQEQGGDRGHQHGPVADPGHSHDYVRSSDGAVLIHVDPVRPQADSTTLVSGGSTTRLARLPDAVAKPEPDPKPTAACSGRALSAGARSAYQGAFTSEAELRRLPSALRRGYDEAARRLGVESPVACLTRGEHLAHVLAARGNAEAFTWEGLASARHALDQLAAFQ